MICYLMRHGKDDDSIRGGWSDSPLTGIGMEQAVSLAHIVSQKVDLYRIAEIYSSDLNRAKQTAQIVFDPLNLPITYLAEFREVNNGLLAGMKNEVAKAEYPGLYWDSLGWDDPYPMGESPRQFFLRVSEAWHSLSSKIRNQNQNVVLVTHSGVINIILHLIHGTKYTNKEKQESIPHAAFIPIEYRENKWVRL